MLHYLLARHSQWHFWTQLLSNQKIQKGRLIFSMSYSFLWYPFQSLGEYWNERNFGPKCQCAIYLKYVELCNQFYMKINGMKKHEYECCFGHFHKRMKDVWFIPEQKSGCRLQIDWAKVMLLESVIVYKSKISTIFDLYIFWKIWGDKAFSLTPPLARLWILKCFLTKHFLVNLWNFKE